MLGVLPGIVGSIQALETIKVMLGLGEPLIGRILTVDTTEMEFRAFNLKPDPANVVTYDNRDRIEIRDLDGLCAPGSPTTDVLMTLRIVQRSSDDKESSGRSGQATSTTRPAWSLASTPVSGV